MRTNIRIAWVLSAALALSLGAAQIDIQNDRSAEAQLQAAITKETVEGDLKGAIELYEKLADGEDHAVAAKALVRMGQCYEKLGNSEAKKAYERVVREFADQKEPVATARTRLTALSRGTRLAPGVAFRQVWAGPWYGGLGAPSSDGTYLSFRTDSEDLAIRDLATGKIRQLTKHKSPQQSAYQSMPSPDGNQVAYSWYNDGRSELRVVGLDGSEPRILISDAEIAWLKLADWSPDGEAILTVLDRKDTQTSILALISAQDASIHPLKSFEERGPGRPRFSPDGRFVVYDRPQDEHSGKSDIVILDLEGGREIPLIEHPDNDVYPDWTPDGKRILFLSNRSGATGAWWIQVAKGIPHGTPELVKPDLGEDLIPMGFTRSGSYYYGVHTEMSDVYIAELDLATGKLISVPSAATQRFVGSNSKPDWSPDGRQLLFFSKRGPGTWGTRAFCVRSTETGEVRELTSKLDRMPWARWSLDGRSVLGPANHPTEGIGFYRIDVDTGDYVAIPGLPGQFGYLPAASPDGKAIIYQGETEEPKKYCVLLRELKTGKNKELYCFADPATFLGRLTLSPDGSQLAFVITEDGSTVLKVMPVAGGEARDLLRGVEMPRCEAPIAWTPDGSGLLFLKQPNPPEPKTELWFVSIKGGESRRLELAAEGMVDICLHPDGRHIAFTEVKDRDGVWVLENFLPVRKIIK